MTDDQIRGCRQIALHFGRAAQVKQTLQEFAELQQLLCLRDDQIARHPEYSAHVAEEIADCMIMLQQMADLYDVRKAVECNIAGKIDRTLEVIHGKSSF